MAIKQIRCRLALLLMTTAMFCACQSPKQTQIPTTVHLYIGTYTNDGSKGIYRADFDTVTGQISGDTLAAEILSPSYLTVSRNGRYLAAVSEDDSRSAKLFTFAIDSLTGGLTLISNIETGAFGPCYVSTIGDSVVCTANYRSGNVCFTPSTTNGELLTSTQTFTHNGIGPNTDRQEKPHAHCIVPDLEGNYIYSADLGADKIMVYQNIADSVVFVKEIPVSPGSGPRHIAFHPQMKSMAVVNELIPAIELYAKDSAGIFSVKTQSSLLLPDTITGANTAADIHFSADGKFVYATNRGSDFIAVYAVNDAADTLTVVEHHSGMLNWPRNFVIDPSGKFVLVANQKGHDVVVFSRNAQTGRLTDTGNRLKINSPACLKF